MMLGANVIDPPLSPARTDCPVVQDAAQSTVCKRFHQSCESTSRVLAAPSFPLLPRLRRVNTRSRQQHFHFTRTSSAVVLVKT